MRSAGPARSPLLVVAALILGSALSMLSGGCAVILGFQDDVLRSEAGADGATEGNVRDARLDRKGSDRDDDASSDTSSPDADQDACGPVEVCGNGVDDDCNGKTDCADPACQPDFVCVPITPSGWTGPTELFVGAVPGSPPVCSGDFATEVFDGKADPTEMDDTCSPCACGSPKGGVCGSATASFFSDSSCTTACPSTGKNSTSLTSSSCTDVASFSGSCGYLSVDLPAPSGGKCTPTGGVSKSTAWTWTKQARACGTKTTSAPGGCDAGMECAPKPKPPFEVSSCIVQAGKAACPASYPNPMTYFASSDDERTCTACTCSSPTGMTCAGSVTEYRKSGCSHGITTFDAPVACAPSSGAAQSADMEGGIATGGACTAKGGQPTGKVVPTGPTTLCCAP